MQQPSVSHENTDENESDIFDQATQMMVDPTPTKRISVVAQSQCLPVNTPPWTMAARLPNDAIEQFEKQKQAEREAAKEKVRKRRYLFASSSEEEDDDESDLEFDLGKPAERIARMTAIKESTSDESLEEPAVENHSKNDAKNRSDEKRPPPKKQKSNDENVEVNGPQPAKRTTRQVSVKVSREEVARHLRNHDEAVKSKKTTKAPATKTDKSNHPKTAQQENSDPTEDATDVRKSKRTKKPVRNESPAPPPAREKRTQTNAKANADTPNAGRNTRGAKKAKPNNDGDGSPNDSLVIGTVSKNCRFF